MAKYGIIEHVTQAFNFQQIAFKQFATFAESVPSSEISWNDLAKYQILAVQNKSLHGLVKIELHGLGSLVLNSQYLK